MPRFILAFFFPVNFLLLSYFLRYTGIFTGCIKHIFHSSNYCPSQKLMNLMNMCSWSSLKSTARGWQSDCQKFWAHSFICILAGINLWGLQVGLAAYAFHSSRCCNKKWQQSNWASSGLPEHDQLLTVPAKPTELVCFSVMVHSSWYRASSYCKPAGLKQGGFTCQRRRAQEISGKFQPAFISSSTLSESSCLPPMGQVLSLLAIV